MTSAASQSCTTVDSVTTSTAAVCWGRVPAQAWPAAVHQVERKWRTAYYCSTPSFVLCLGLLLTLLIFICYVPWAVVRSSAWRHQQG
jgi:hypothetical protein